jgi:hypothetical protein
MARDHARLLVTIWDDADFVSRTTDAQSVYFSLISSRDLSWCGVAPLLPQRLVRNAANLTERKVRSAMAELANARFLILDHETAEVLVRSYVRHDGILKQPNVTKALARALDRVHSDRLRDAVKVELARLLVDQPDHKGWDVIRSGWPDLFAELLAKGQPNPSATPSITPSRKAG